MSTTEKKNNNSMMHLSHSEKAEGGKIGKKKNEISMRSESVLKKGEPRKKWEDHIHCAGTGRVSLPRSRSPHAMEGMIVRGVECKPNWKNKIGCYTLFEHDFYHKIY